MVDALERDALQVGLDTELVNSFVVGAGSVLRLSGWCFHPWQRVHDLHVVADGIAHPVYIRGIVTVDIFKANAPDRDHTGNSLNSGFYALVPFSRVDTPRAIDLTLRAILADGSECDAALGRIMVLPYASKAEAITFPDMSDQPEEPRLAICMATYNPPLDLFEQQVDCIIAQSHRNWICIVNDDGSVPANYEAMRRILARDQRFFLFRNAARRNFYHNFEAALERVPTSAQFVALCDQDDRWYPEKLRASLRPFTPSTTLVYTDLDVVTREGALVHHSYWVGRRNNYTDFKALLFANTVTGAASVFRAELLRDILPLPPRLGDSFHDHWIACVAMARGQLGYVAEPMYAYRQHEGNVIGHSTRKPLRVDLREVARTLSSPARLKAAVSTAFWNQRHVYYNDVLRLALFARTLQLRCQDMSPGKRQIVRELARIEYSLPALVWESIASLRRRRVTLGEEWRCARGMLADHILNRGYQMRSSAAYARLRARKAPADSRRLDAPSRRARQID